MKLAHFDLFEEIGHGGMGVVHRAFDPTLNRQVAIKLLREDLTKDPRIAEGFLREARNAAAISHPHIVQVHFVGEAGGHYYIVMELLKGRTLEEILEKKEPLNEERMLEIAIDVAEALRGGYKNQIVHGDIKPQNIFVTEDLGAKVLDFGLAKLANVEVAAEESVWGSPYYMSPERVGQKAEDFRSDVYSLGATIFHALAGRPPFDAEDATQLALKRLNEKPPLVREVNPNLTAKTEQVVNKMLNKSILLRYRDYDSLLEDLRAARTEAAAKRLGVDMHAKPQPATVDASRQSRLPKIAGVAALVVAGVLALVFLPLKPSKPRPTQAAVPASAATVAPQRSPSRTTQPPPPSAAQQEAEKRAATEREQRAQQAAAEQKQKEEALRELYEKEKGVVETTDKSLSSLLQAYDFKQALGRYESLATKVATLNGRKLVQHRVATSKTLLEFKTQLSADFAKRPYDQGDLKTRTAMAVANKIIRATDSQLAFAVQYGEVMKPWSDFDPATLAHVAEFYANQSTQAEPPEAQARRFLTLAVFCNQYGMAKPSASYASKAKQLIPPLQKEMQQELKILLEKSAG